jgi:hypothetical protein
VLLTKISWTNRLLVAVPIAVAAWLNAVMVGVDHFRLRLDLIARYGFAFSGPWAWIVNVADITNRLNVQNGCLRGFITYVAILWIPAVLYSVFVCLLLLVIEVAARRFLNRRDPDVAKTLKRRTAITFSIVVVAVVSCFAVKLCVAQIACNKRRAAFASRIDSIKRDADEGLSIGKTSADVSRFFAEHGIPLQIARSEAIGTLYTSGCGPLGCGTDSALIGVRVKLDSAGAVAEKPKVVGMYTDCL